MLAREKFGKNLRNPTTLCYQRLKVLVVVTMKFDIYLDVTPCRPVVLYRCIKEAPLYPSVNLEQTMQQNISEDENVIGF